MVSYSILQCPTYHYRCTALITLHITPRENSDHKYITDHTIIGFVSIPSHQTQNTQPEWTSPLLQQQTPISINI